MADRNHLYGISAISGACAMLVEVASTRIIAPYLGNTIYTWAAIIGFVLAALSLGYYYGGKLADKYNDSRQLAQILFYAAIATVIIPGLGKVLLPVFSVFQVEIGSILSAFIIVPASFFYGMVTPYIIKLTAKIKEEGASAGNIFAVSTVGSIVGTLATGFILIPNMQITHIFIMATALMILSAWISNNRKVESKNKVDLVMIVAFSILISNMSFAPQFGTVVYQANSPYYYITIAEGEYKNENGRILFLDNSPSSGERSDGSPIFKYMEKSRMAYETLNNSPEEALVIGAAAGVQIEDVKMSFPDVHVTGIEIDPKIIEIGKDYFSLKDDSRTTIIIDDARRYLTHNDKKYDLVLVDAYRGKSIPYHLASVEFVQLLKQRTNDKGVVIINVISSLEGRDSKQFELLYNIYSSQFNNSIVLPIQKDNPGIKQNIVLVMSNNDMTKFKKKYKDQIYQPTINDRRLPSDELNPIEVYAN